MCRRGNGFGTLVYKGEGRPWLAKWMYGGKVFTRSTGCIDKDKAYKQLEVITRPYRERREEDVLENLAIKLRRARDSRSRERLEPKNLWNAFKEKLWDGNASKGTMASYEKYVSNLVKWMDECGFKDVSKVKKRDAEKYLKDLAEKNSAGTFNNMLVLFKRIWKTLGDEYMLDESVWKDFKKIKGYKTMRRAFKPEEIWSIVEKAGADEDMMVLVALGVYTGLRLGDCACMKWSSVDFSRKILSVVPMKTKKHMDGPVEIPMHDALGKVLRDVWKDGEEYVSLRNKMQYEHGHLNGRVTALLKNCGIETSVEVDGKKKLIAGFHSFRHTFVSMAINSGMSPMLVQKIVGHSAVSMTAHYWHEAADVAAEGIAKLPDFMD